MGIRNVEVWGSQKKSDEKLKEFALKVIKFKSKTEKTYISCVDHCRD